MNDQTKELDAEILKILESAFKDPIDIPCPHCVAKDKVLKLLRDFEFTEDGKTYRLKAVPDGFELPENTYEKEGMNAYILPDEEFAPFSTATNREYLIYGFKAGADKTIRAIIEQIKGIDVNGQLSPKR